MMSLTLPPEFDAFIQARVASGAYGSEHEVLQMAFNLLESREWLLAHIDEGRQQLELGQFTEYGEQDRDKFISDIAGSSTNTKPPGQSK
jgi:putative addiction module CopG family antidote